MWASKLFLNEIGGNIFSSIVSIVALIIAGLIIYLVARRKYDQKRQHLKLKRRLTYVMFLIAALVLIKIWVSGFTHIFTVLGIVAVGLTVANKESIMNLIGWLIINWRGLFTEGDFIKISGFSGYVHTIGPLFFRIYEADESSPNFTNGKSIKIPNGLIITNPVTAYSTDNNLCRYSLSCSIELNKQHRELPLHIKSEWQAFLENYYAEDKRYNLKTIKSRNRSLSELIKFEPSVRLQIDDPQHRGITLKCSFYCFPKDYQSLSAEYWQLLFDLHYKNQLKLDLQSGIQ